MGCRMGWAMLQHMTAQRGRGGNRAGYRPGRDSGGTRLWHLLVCKGTRPVVGWAGQCYRTGWQAGDVTCPDKG